MTEIKHAVEAEIPITLAVLAEANFSNSWLGGEFAKRELNHRCPIKRDGECSMLHTPPVGFLGILAARS